MSDTTLSPYLDAYQAYWDAGWRGILPLPPAKKWPPPGGTTGYDGVDPSFADCYAWSDTQPDGNIALRLPPHIIGIDVDAYDGRPGADTLTQLVDDHGPLPPTWLSTSRGDGISGIRLYTIPAGTRLVTALPGVELIQHHHRYVVAPPSQHPNGGRYVWVDEATGETGPDIHPPTHQLPALPDAWLTALTDTAPNNSGGKVEVDDTATTHILTTLPDGDPCRHILAAAGHAVAGSDRHDSYNRAVLAVLSRGRDGCPGAGTVLKRLRAAFLAEISDRATPGEAAGEWARSLRGAVALVAARPLGPGACPDTLIPDQPDPIDLTDNPNSDQEEDDPVAAAYTQAVNVKARELRILDDARQQVAAHAAGQTPDITGVVLTDFLTEPDLPTAYRVDELWPAQGRVLLVAAAKTGKTTMVGRNLLPALVDGGQFLGRFTTPPTTRRVAYLNMEVSPNTLRAWMRTAGIVDTGRVVVANLRGQSSALQLSTKPGRERFTQWLRSHDVGTVILDPLAPVLASLGLVEDSNSDVARFFAWWSEALADADVTDDLICHHAGHSGNRSRGASRLLDEPDAIWTITRQQEKEPGDEDGFLPVDDTRFMAAYGRDVDIKESVLEYRHDTGLLTLTGMSAGEMRQARKKERAEDAVIENMREAARSGHATVSLRQVTKDLGGCRQTDLAAALRRLTAAGRIGVEAGPTYDRYYLLTPPNQGVSPGVSGDPGDGAVSGPLKGVRGDGLQDPGDSGGNGSHL